MEWLNNGLTIMGVIGTAASLWGAYKSLMFYKKNKQLTIYSNTNIAYIESQKIKTYFLELLKQAREVNNLRRRGNNYYNEISLNGEKIIKSLNKIRESLPVDDCKEINELLNSHHIEEYINLFISGSIVKDEQVIIDDKYSMCKQVFDEMQLLIKRKMEDIQDKVK